MNAREVIANALRSTDVDGWESSRPMLHGNGPNGHAYYLGCALCAGDVDTLTDAVLTALADAGLIVTADAASSEDPGTNSLRAAADEWDRLNAGPDFTELEALGREYRPGLNVVSIWLRLRADAIGGGQ